MLRWRLILEESGPDLFHLPGKNNAAVDVLSTLDHLSSSSPISSDDIAEHFTYKKQDDLLDEAFPLTHNLIMKQQILDKDLLAKAEAKDGYVLTNF